MQIAPVQRCAMQPKKYPPAKPSRKRRNAQTSSAYANAAGIPKFITALRIGRSGAGLLANQIGHDVECPGRFELKGKGPGLTRFWGEALAGAEWVAFQGGNNKETAKFSVWLGPLAASPAERPMTTSPLGFSCMFQTDLPIVETT